MNFECKEISISDEELGCQLVFQEHKSLGEEIENMTIEEIQKSTGKYFLLQRFYPEDDYEKSYCYLESHDENLIDDLQCFETLEIILSRRLFTLKINANIIEISIKPTEKEFAELKLILPIIINGQGELIINE